MAVEEITLDTAPDLFVQEDVTLLPGAADKIRSLLSERNLSGHDRRVFVAGRGSYGMQ
jgi:hypothetical protein